jgi:hypothetical protein
MKRTRLSNRGACTHWLWGLTILFFCALTAAADGPTERLFMWNEANARMCAAQTREDFAAAAAAYRRLAAAGARNDVLFYNLGTALLKAERYGEAAMALLRAERYGGTTPDIERNLEIALAAGRKDGTAALPWYRPLLFWHYSLAAEVRAGIAALAFSGIWLALALRVMGFRRAAGPLLTLSVTLLILFGSSALTSVHEESRAALRERMALAQPQT